MATITFDSVDKVYEDGTHAVDSLSLEVGDGEFMVFVGPSGCGKTTALRMVAGLEDIDGGEIRIGERIVNTLEPRDRDVAMVFQNYALYPHMTVYENLAFGLKMKKVPKDERRRRVEQIARTLGLHESLDRRPRALSGGQRQRVAMGRAIVRDPQAFLMDEPLSNLDAKLRVQMRSEIARIQREVRATTIYVTHDQVEAMTMGDRVAVLRRGRLQQIDGPQRLYDAPTNLFVASFIGSPAMNLVQARLEQHNGVLACVVGDQKLAIPGELGAGRSALAGYIGRTVALGIRPEHVNDASLAPDAPAEARLAGSVTITEALGSELLVHVQVAAQPVTTEEVLEVAQDVDEAAVQELEIEAGQNQTIFVGRFDAQSRVRGGQPVELVVDTSKLHFFDLESGLALGV
jgi:multiple sugar transport system ATP-binding protein